METKIKTYESITVDHDEAPLIMEWLYEHYQITGSEVDLIGDPIVFLIADSGLIALESFLSMYYDLPILVSPETKFIESII